MVDDAYTRNEDGELAVRTVSTSGDTGTNPNDVFTRDDEGRLAIRTTGSSGGGDQHNLGYFATQAALEEAHPTAEAGDWAIVGATDTVWLWDSDNSQWVDSDQKGQVTSVNGQTGDVTLTASDVGAATTAQGAKADTAVQPADLATVATTGDYDDLLNKPTIPPAQVNSDWNANSGVAQILNKPTIPEAVQYDTMPTASADNLGDIVQFTGTTDANYTNGYFYKCTGAGDPVVYSWTRVDVQPTPVIPDPLPSQTGNAGKFLTTDGTGASWSDKPLVNLSAVSNTSIVLSPANKSTGINNNFCVVLGWEAYANSQWSIIVGGQSSVYGQQGIAIGRNASANTNSLAVGAFAQAAATNCIQITTGGSVSNNKNNDANTFKVGNANGNFELMSADGTVPTARLTKVNTTATLAVADWSSNTQTVSVTGVAADSVVFVSPAPASASDYASAGILCTAQAAGTLTFTCDTVPSNAITVNVVCL